MALSLCTELNQDNESSVEQNIVHQRSHVLLLYENYCYSRTGIQTQTFFTESQIDEVRKHTGESGDKSGIAWRGGDPDAFFLPTHGTFRRETIIRRLFSSTGAAKHLWNLELKERACGILCRVGTELENACK